MHEFPWKKYRKREQSVMSCVYVDDVDIWYPSSLSFVIILKMWAYYSGNALYLCLLNIHVALQWRHKEPHGVLKHRYLECLLSRLFRRTSKKTSKPSVTGLCEGNPPVTGGFPAQRASYTEMFSFDDVIMDAAHKPVMMFRCIVNILAPQSFGEGSAVEWVIDSDMVPLMGSFLRKLRSPWCAYSKNSAFMYNVWAVFYLRLIWSSHSMLI